MNLEDVLKKITDRYERQARLYPAMLAGSPILVVCVSVYGFQLELDETVVGAVFGLGIIYLLANVARELGKRLEPALFRIWGGKPTTQLLRHSNPSIDHITKARYHAFLSRNLRVSFPSPEAEHASPKDADAIYESAGRWLLEQTRDTKRFPLLFKELVAYGFRRNCLGLKSFAILNGIVCLCWILISQDIAVGMRFSLEKLLWSPLSARAGIAIVLVFLSIWTFFVSKRTVKTSAFMYSDLLLRACDELDDNNSRKIL